MGQIVFKITGASTPIIATLSPYVGINMVFNLNGTHTIEGVPAGTYTLIVSDWEDCVVSKSGIIVPTTTSTTSTSTSSTTTTSTTSTSTSSTTSTSTSSTSTSSSTTTTTTLCGYGYNMLDLGLSSAEIDDILGCYADAGVSSVVIDIRGNDQRTAASDADFATLIGNGCIILEDYYSTSTSTSTTSTSTTSTSTSYTTSSSTSSTSTSSSTTTTTP